MPCSISWRAIFARTSSIAHRDQKSAKLRDVNLLSSPRKRRLRGDDSHCVANGSATGLRKFDDEFQASLSTVS
jgi:hypothetical protein